MLRRHRHVHREDRAQAGDCSRNAGPDGLRRISLHKISSKCGIFAEADANTLLKAGVPVEEIIACLFEAVVYQNLATLTRGNTPSPEVLLLGGPNLFFKGLQEAWRHHLGKVWEERKVAVADDRDVSTPHPRARQCLVLRRAGMRGSRLAGKRSRGSLHRSRAAQVLDRRGPVRREKENRAAADSVRDDADLSSFKDEIRKARKRRQRARRRRQAAASLGPIVLGCDFGSTTAKAVCMSPEKELLFSCYALSKGNPIEDAKSLFRQIRTVVSDSDIMALALTGYGKDLLKGILGADCPVVETIAHASAGLHFFPDADCICDVGGVDVKIMLLNNGAVTDFRLNSQCSSGNGAFLQGVAERFNIPMGDMADGAFQAKAMPQLSMGCGVFLQSDIVNQQRKGWQAEEILAGLCAILPLNVWIYAGGMNNLQQVGRKYILQGGTHRNLAVVKTQVDFILNKVPDAEVVVHPYSGEAGAIGAGLVALDWWKNGGRSNVPRLRRD